MLIELSPQVKRHDLIFQLPDAYMPELKRAEKLINELARQEYARIKADFDQKSLELETEKELLKQDMATIRAYTISAINLNLQWHTEAIWLNGDLARQEIDQAKAKIQAEAEERVAAWQQSTEAVLAENEGLQAELMGYKTLLKEMGRAKKPERIIALLQKFNEVTK